MREICTSGLKRGAEPNGSAPTRLENLFVFIASPRGATAKRLRTASSMAITSRAWNSKAGQVEQNM